MKKGEVPQDDIRHFRTARKAAYAGVGRGGTLHDVPTTGLGRGGGDLYQAIGEFEEQAEAAGSASFAGRLAHCLFHVQALHGSHGPGPAMGLPK
jgi:hypothetical protein